MLHSYRVGFLGNWVGSASIYCHACHCVNGVVPMVVLSLANCDSYSCSNNWRLSCTVAESSCHGGLKVSGVMVFIHHFLQCDTVCMMYILSICRIQDCWCEVSNIFSFVKCKVFICVIRDKNVNRCPVLDLVIAINYVNVWISSFGSTVICKEVCHLCGDKWSTDLDWDHTICVWVVSWELIWLYLLLLCKYWHV